MKLDVLIRTYDAPPVSEREILRYAGCREADPTVEALLHTCFAEAEPKLTYQVCYRELPVKIADGVCDFGCFSVTSAKLSKQLNGCKNVLLLGATVGIGLDQLIARYGKISPAKALLFQAIGAERIEALCDAFGEDFEAETHTKLRSRFSPGYGDLPMDVQKDIFSVLDPTRHIGLFLTDRLLMSPTKSVTAFIGIESNI